jgi:Skp family chaperone for outer membrane proteins
MSVTNAGFAPLVLLFALLGTLAEAQAQQAPPAPAPAAPAAPAAAAPGPTAAPGLSILVVDVQSLLQNSKSAKMVRQQIEQKRAEYAKEISHQEEVLRQERDALQRQIAALSSQAQSQKGSEAQQKEAQQKLAEVESQKGRDFQAKVNELDRSVQGKRQALEHSNADALEKIQEAMLKIITDISKDRKANLVFQRSELVLFDQGFDVTDEVLQKLDEQLPTLTVNFVAPVATPAPAAQPAPAPAPAPKKKK